MLLLAWIQDKDESFVDYATIQILCSEKNKFILYIEQLYCIVNYITFIVRVWLPER